MFSLPRTKLGQAALAALWLSACVPTDGEGGGVGELRKGRFRYLCVKGGDHVCGSSFGMEDFEPKDRRLPDAIAVGGEFSLQYVGKVGGDTSEPSAKVQAVSVQDQVGSGHFSIARPADASFIAIRSSGKVVDYVNVRAEEVFKIEIQKDRDKVKSLVLKTNETVMLTAVPMSKAGDELGGSLNYEWRADSQGLLKLEREDVEWENYHGDGGDLRITGLTPGKTLLSVKNAALTQTIEVSVK